MQRETTIMKALVYQGPARQAMEERATPRVQAPTDAIVRVTKTTICGTDLHIVKGDVSTSSHGRILGHKGVGVIENIGPGVTTFHPGDSVLDIVHLRLRQVRILPPQHELPLRDRRLDTAVTKSMALKPNTCTSRMPTRASTRCPRASTNKPWSC